MPNNMNKEEVPEKKTITVNKTGKGKKIKMKSGLSIKIVREKQKFLFSC